MRRPAPLALLIPAVLLTLGCSSKLEKAKAEDLLAKAYPVVVSVTVPGHAVAEKGSPEAVRLSALNEALEHTGWFEQVKVDDGAKDTYTFRLRPSAPKTVQAGPKGFIVPAAEAVFVKALRMEPTREGARVTYQIRLANPTAQFDLFKALHPDVALGATKERHATFVRQLGSWKLKDTDESFHKAD